MQACRAIVICLLVGAVLPYATAAPNTATVLGVPEPSFFDPRIESTQANPPGFEIRLTKRMPTPGWRFEIESLEIDVVGRRITVRVDESPPAGVVPQVLTKTDLAIDLGALPRGRFLFELWTRRGGEGAFNPAQALILAAR